MSNKLKKIVKYLINVLLCVVVVAIFFALYGFVQLVFLDKPYANYFGYTLFEIESGSMSPTINVNDMILVKLTDEIKKDDIITYKSDSSFITHRVIEVGETKLITKGDYNNSEDKIVAKTDVIGKVVKVFPKFGIWKKTILSPEIMIAIFITLMLFSLCYSYNGKKYLGHTNKNKDNIPNENVIDNLKIRVVHNNNYNLILKNEDTKEEIILDDDVEILEDEEEIL
jgi:signal peptidase I